MWNPFSKNKKSNSNRAGMLQSLAMKKMMKMSPQEREKIAQDMMKPENHDKILKAMEMMKKTGMISDAQIEEAKKKLGM